MSEFQTDVHQCPFCKLRCLDRNVRSDHVIGDHPSHADSCVVSERVAMIASSSSPPSSPVGFIMTFPYNGLIRSPGVAATRAGRQGPDGAAAPLRRVGVQRRRPRRPGSRARARRPGDLERLHRGDNADWVWQFFLQPEGSGTRLIVRSRYRRHQLLLELVHFVMEQRMMLTIKRLSEQNTGRPRAISTIPRTSAA